MTSCRSCTDAHGNVVEYTSVYGMCTELSRIKHKINSGHDQKRFTLQARSSDQAIKIQDPIVDDQDFDPGRGRFHRRVLGDYPLLGVTAKRADSCREGVCRLRKAFWHDFSGPATLSCSTDRTYELPGSQLWAVLSSEKSRSPAMAITVSKSRHNSRTKL